jgi:hypothetical protein
MSEAAFTDFFSETSETYNPRTNTTNRGEDQITTTSTNVIAVRLPSGWIELPAKNPTSMSYLADEKVIYINGTRLPYSGGSMPMAFGVSHSSTSSNIAHGRSSKTTNMFADIGNSIRIISY